MVAKLIKFALLLVALAFLAGCSMKAMQARKAPTAMALKDQKRKIFEPVILTQVLSETPLGNLYLKPKSYPNGIYVCAIENLSKPCLPKLSAIVAAKLSQAGLTIEPDQKQAEATLYFEAWFDSFSSHTNALVSVKGVQNNPTIMGKTFATKIEQSLTTGNLPDVHKHIRDGIDPFSMVSINADDEQKFIYVAFTAVEMANAIDYPGEGEKHIGASKNPWIKQGATKRISWLAVKKIQAETRSLIGVYNGEVPTEKAAMPMMMDAIDLLLNRTAQLPKK
ncbi:MAG: hypothetical protein WCI39_06620 [Gallionellaceae bacterium]